MTPFSRRHAALLSVCFILFCSCNALVPPPTFRVGDVRRSGLVSSRRVYVGPRHVKAAGDGESKENGLIRRFLKSLSRGIFFAFPMRPSLTQALFGIKGKRKNEKKNPASAAASVSFSLRECFLSIGVYLLLGICAYSVLMEHWSLVDAVYFSMTTFTTVRTSVRLH